MRQSAAQVIAAPVRLLAAVAAALAAAFAGLAYVVLLPVCGLASIAEAIAKASWRAAKSRARASIGRGALPQH